MWRVDDKVKVEPQEEPPPQQGCGLRHPQFPGGRGVCYVSMARSARRERGLACG
jgi:hypothetical protein